MIMKNTVTDELVNKVYHLTKALNKAENLVETLQQENENLKKLLEDIDHNENKIMSYDYIGV